MFDGGSILELSATIYAQHQAALASLTEVTPAAHLTTKTLLHQSNTMSLAIKDNMKHLAEASLTYKLLHPASSEL